VRPGKGVTVVSSNPPRRYATLFSTAIGTPPRGLQINCPPFYFDSNIDVSAVWQYSVEFDSQVVILENRGLHSNLKDSGGPSAVILGAGS